MMHAQAKQWNLNLSKTCKNSTGYVLIPIIDGRVYWCDGMSLQGLEHWRQAPGCFHNRSGETHRRGVVFVAPLAGGIR